MDLLHIAVLALVQGITEFLPVSSSGHLILVPQLTDWPDQGLIIDVAAHVGTLGAVMIYFWRDLWAMAIGVLRALGGRRDPGARTAANVVIASIPLVIAGFALNYFLPTGIRSLEFIAWATIGFGIVLWVTDRLGMTLRRVEHLQVSDAVVIGLAQCLALIPGTSRSGITMSAARMLGMERQDAARFSMLMSIPAILGAGVLKGTELVAMGDQQLTVSAILAAVLAFASALVAIALLMAWLRRSTFTPFVIYRILLGVILLGIVHGWWTA